MLADGQFSYAKALRDISDARSRRSKNVTKKFVDRIRGINKIISTACYSEMVFSSRSLLIDDEYSTNILRDYGIIAPADVVANELPEMETVFSTLPL